jgi:outer membrane murein-binding lipoprotein Lpp
MKTIINILLAGLFSGAVLTGCSKSEAMSDLKENSQTIAAKQDGDINADASILNKDLGIIYAKDGAADITNQFKDFTFNFTGAPPSGPAHVWNDLLSQTGNWGIGNGEEGDYFTIGYPTDIFTQLVFLNRSWTIGESSSAVIRLIAADGDEVHFSAK